MILHQLQNSIFCKTFPKRFQLFVERIRELPRTTNSLHTLSKSNTEYLKLSKIGFCQWSYNFGKQAELSWAKLIQHWAMYGICLLSFVVSFRLKFGSWKCLKENSETLIIFCFKTMFFEQIFLPYDCCGSNSIGRNVGLSVSWSDFPQRV